MCPVCVQLYRAGVLSTSACIPTNTHLHCMAVATSMYCTDIPPRSACIPGMSHEQQPVLHAIECRDHITNEEVKARIGNAIRRYEDLLTSVKRRKLKWYWHVTRSSGLAKTIQQGTVQGGRQRGRQRKRWEDNIKEWTGLEWNILLRKAENCEV